LLYALNNVILCVQDQYLESFLQGNQMITLKQWMELVDYQISEGSAFGWLCYGPEAYSLDSWNGEQDGHSFTVIFDRKNKTVYEVQAHDYRNNRAYRMIHADYVDALAGESLTRGVDMNNAWDNVNYVVLETEEDFLEKSRAIMLGRDYDTRVSVPVDLEDDLILHVAMEAHRRDITMNKMFELILQQAIDRYKTEGAI
jgi:hypothetical protein